MCTQQVIPELLTVRQVCTYLHMSRATLYRRPYRYVEEGGRRLYFAEDIRMYLTLNTVTP